MRTIIALIALAAAIASLSCTAPQPEPATPTLTPTPIPSPTPEGTVREVTVGPEREECTGSAPQLCLVVDGELFYDEIDGFQHEAGYQYRLRIEQYDRWPGQAEIPQDAGRYAYRLLELLEKTPAPGG